MKINFKKLNLKFIILLGLFILIILSGVTYVVAVGTFSEGYMLATGAGAQNITIDSNGTCKKITNNSGKNLFIPTKTTAEWNAFNANKPSGVTIEACCTWQWVSYCPVSVCNNGNCEEMVYSYEPLHYVCNTEMYGYACYMDWCPPSDPEHGTCSQRCGCMCAYQPTPVWVCQ